MDPKPTTLVSIQTFFFNQHTFEFRITSEKRPKILQISVKIWNPESIYEQTQNLIKLQSNQILIFLNEPI